MYFIGVFAKAFQQRNVAFVNFKMILPISYVLALTDVTVIGLVTLEAIGAHELTDMFWMIASIGTGGGLGALAAMYLHHKYFTHERFK